MFSFLKRKIKIQNNKLQAPIILKNRLKFLILFFIFCFVVIITRLSFISLQKPKTKILTHAARYNRYISITDVDRLPVTDRNDIIIASDIETVSLFINKELLENPSQTAIEISKILTDLDFNYLFHKISNIPERTQYILIKKNLAPQQQLELKKLGLASVAFKKNKTRIYPHNNLFSHTIGYTDIDRNGLSGLEKQYDTYLKNPLNIPLKTTLDIRVQNILKQEMLKGMTKFKPKAMSGIIMNARNGQILAVVSLPDFNPNNQTAATQEQKFNRATYGVYEIGSIFKLFTIAAALETKSIKLSDVYEVAKPIKYGKYTIKDMHFKKRKMTVEEILIYSSNIGAAKIALELGEEIQQQFLKKANLLNKLQSDFPSLGRPLYPKNWRIINLMTISYGHGIAVTPLHVVTSVSGLVNDGVMHNPKFTFQAKDTNINLISKKSSKNMRKLMRKTVIEGTGWRANTLGYSVGGKTGTAEKIVDGKYSEDKTRVAFIASFPMNNPYLTVFIMLDEPDGTDAGRMNTASALAAPIVSRIIENIAPILGVIPSVDRIE